jgi:hypothetical protein
MEIETEIETKDILVEIEIEQIKFLLHYGM